jgi:site-specific DNA-methyltransferase (adenine-specific)
MGVASQNNEKRGKSGSYYTKKDWDSKPPSFEYFDELQRVSVNQIIWGANHFIDRVSKPSPCWIVWNKKTCGNIADCELAYTSFKTAVRRFDFLWEGFWQENMMRKEKRIHPTQKPVALYEWLLTNYAKPGDRILDTHLGSGSSAIAAHNLGFDFVGMELDADYYAAACKRFEAHKRQQTLFQPDDYDRVTRDYQESIF